MSANAWVKRLFRSPSRPVRRADCRPAARPGLERLEDRTAPAVLSATGTTLNVLLDAAGEKLHVAATAAGVSLTTDHAFSGLALGPGPATFGAPYNALRVTDAAAGTSVTFDDSGTRAYGLDVAVALSHGSAGVTFTGTSDFGAHPLGVRADWGITVAAAAAVKAGAGTIALDGGHGTGPLSGKFIGVDVEGSVTTTGGGIRLTGAGGNDAGGHQYGVEVGAAGQVAAGGAGTVCLTGTGGSGAGDWDIGVTFDGTVRSGGGDVTLTGTGGPGTGKFLYGVDVFSGGQVTAGGAGAVRVMGRGGASGGDYAAGVDVEDALITSTAGPVTVTGAGGAGGSGREDRGVSVAYGGRITSGGSGHVTVTGIGGAGAGGKSVGVQLATGGQVTSGEGAGVTVTGTGGTRGDPADGSNYGVEVDPGCTITSGGGPVVVNGTGGSGGTTGANGVMVSGLVTSGGSGVVTVIGTGGAGGMQSAYGVYVNAGTVTSGGAGAVTVRGTGGTSEQGNYGVGVCHGALVTSGGGPVIVTGTGGAAGWEFNTGVVVVQGKVTSGGGSVTVTGTGGVGQAADGVLVADTVTSGGSGAVTVIGKGGKGDFSAGVSVDMGSISSAGAGAVTVVGTAEGPVGYGVALGLQQGVTEIRDPALPAVSATGSGAVTITGTGGPLGKGVWVRSAGIVAAGGDLTVTGTSTASQLPPPATYTYPEEYHNTGIELWNATIRNGSGPGLPGNVTITGTVQGNEGSNNDGVWSRSSRVSVLGSGTLTVSGTGGGGDHSHGVLMQGGNLLAQQGNLVVTGTARDGTGDNNGLDLFGGIRAGGNVSLTGAGWPAAQAVVLEGNTRVAGGSGVTVTADSLSVNTAGPAATLRAGAAGDGTATLQPLTPGTRIDLGGPDVLSGRPLTLGLTAAELARVRAGTLRIGSPITGAITVSQALDLTPFAEVDLTANGPITEQAGASLRTTSLGLKSANGSVVLNAAGNRVGTVAASVAGLGNAFALTNETGVVLGSVGGVSGLSAWGDIAVTANAGGSPGNFVGVDVRRDVTTFLGSIHLTGTGGNDSAGRQYGVYVHAGAVVQARGTGAVVINGTGGPSTGDYNVGVVVEGSGSAVTDAWGLLQIFGTGGGGTGGHDYGVWVTHGGQVFGSLGAHVRGLGGNGGSDRGVVIEG